MTTASKLRQVHRYLRRKASTRKRVHTQTHARTRAANAPAASPVATAFEGRFTERPAAAHQTHCTAMLTQGRDACAHTRINGEST